ncbi:MAG: hypothetical protein WBG08_07615 [Litorimonas sp.]
MRYTIPVFAALAVGFAAPAQAQNVTGVFSPTVSEDDHALEYRAAGVIDAPGDDFLWAQRLHYERAISDNFRPRIVVATEETASNEVELDFIRLEAVWQLTPDDRKHQMGMRFEGRVRTEGAEEIRANFINQWALPNNFRARAILMNTLQVAQRTNNELQFQGRFELSRKLPESGIRLGLHSYVELGDTSDIRAFKDDEAEIGPFIEFDLTDDVAVYIGTLHGLTDASDDNQLRFFIERAF